MKTSFKLSVILIIILCISLWVVANSLNGDGKLFRLTDFKQLVNSENSIMKKWYLMSLINPGRLPDSPKTTTLDENKHNEKRAPHRDSRSVPKETFDDEKHVKRMLGNELIICGRVTCYHDYQVKPCTVNFTADTCVPCPTGTFIYDITKSEERVLKCLPKHHCHDWPGTVSSDEMHACAGDFRMPCRCNTESNVCGLDPCECRKRKCRHDEILLQNCTCASVIKTTTRTSTRPVPTVRRISVTYPFSTREVTTHTTRDWTTPSTLPDPIFKGNGADKVSWNTVGVSIGILIPIMAILYLLYRCCRGTHLEEVLNKRIDTFILGFRYPFGMTSPNYLQHMYGSPNYMYVPYTSPQQWGNFYPCNGYMYNYIPQGPSDSNDTDKKCSSTLVSGGAEDYGSSVFPPLPKIL